MSNTSILLTRIDRLNVMQAVINKLLRQHNRGVNKLVLVLEEISKVCVAIRGELVRYVSLKLDPQGSISEERAVLITLKSRQLQTRISQTRRH